MERALVLNASYEPLSVVSGRRAVVLTLSGAAEMLTSSGAVLRSERCTFEVPSVVRLRRYVRVPFARRAPLNRHSLFVRDRHSCQYCGAPAESIDHVVPKARGGTHTWENVVAACRPCNVSKRDRLLHETTMTLRTVPRAPVGRGWVAVSVGAVPGEWEPFLDPEVLSA